jgi:ubiquinone/menaquinone biosynthesis C-methylase UbiE
MTTPETEQREQVFWDQAVAHTIAEDVVRSARRHDRWDRKALARLGELHGKHVLDVGCGSGRWSIILADHGAKVEAFDLSPASVAICQAAAEVAGHTGNITARAMSLHDLSYPDASFDLAYGQYILHHVEVEEAGRQLARIMKPRSRAVFRENSANNALLMLARNYLCGHFGIPKWSSADEYPLQADEIRLFAAALSASYEAEYPEFVFFHYIDAKFFGYKVPIVNRLCHGLDRAIYVLLPAFRRYSYHQLLLFDRT